MKFSEEVADALSDGRAIVALESTIIAHGFPRPDNLAVGTAMEKAVRDHGAVPATIAVIDGEVLIGLTPASMERLATGTFRKTSLKDLAACIAAGDNGATTVATTAYLAHRAGIPMFATGGIGGVHPPVDGMPPDISADLYAMQQIPVGIVSAGAKSILDLPATLEMLESFGVPVVGFRTDMFPAFHTQSSGLSLSRRFEDPASLARMLKAHWDLGLQTSVMVCNPPPDEAAIDADQLSVWLEHAHRAAAERRVSGADLTPWLLAYLNDVSCGATRRVNFALAVSNAGLAAEIAVAIGPGGSGGAGGVKRQG